MKSSIIALSAIAATAVADAVVYTTCEGNCGSVEIISHCDEDIYFANVPSQGETIGSTCMKSGDSYSQVFTSMPNLAGWSMKLSPEEGFPDGNTQQYEYTWQGGDEPVWYDMSYVNGKPYDGKWNFTSSDVSLCNPTDSAYRYSTDDAYGMQASCPSSVTLTLHLCPDNAGSALSSASASESAAASTASATSATSSYSAPATIGASSAASSATSDASSATTTSAPSSSQTTFATSTSTKAAHTHSWSGYGNKDQVDQSGDVNVGSASTTAVVTTSSIPGGPVVTETQVEVVTQVQTMIVTARDAAPSAPPHAHKLRHEHRHPHGGRA